MSNFPKNPNYPNQGPPYADETQAERNAREGGGRTRVEESDYQRQKTGQTPAEKQARIDAGQPTNEEEVEAQRVAREKSGLPHSETAHNETEAERVERFERLARANQGQPWVGHTTETEAERQARERAAKAKK